MLIAGTLSELTIPAQLNFLPIIVTLAKEIAEWFGFRDEKLREIELIIEESFVSVVENSFEPDELGIVSFKISYLPGKLKFTFEDKGLPVDVDKLEHEERSALGILLIKHLADEFKFVNLGKEGKRIEVVKNLPDEDIKHLVSETIPTEPETAPKDEELKFSMLKSRDALELARLAYRAYGYTYASVAYLPEKLKEILEYGYLEAVTVRNSKDEFIANLGLFYDKPGAKVADSGMAIVDPRYRGHNLFKRMKMQAIEHGKTIGLYGLYSESVTIHPFTQKGNITLGAKETGLLIAFTGERVTFKKINDEGLSQRQAVMLYYLKIAEEQERTVYVPEIYEELMTRIYSDLKLNRVIHTTKSFKSIVEMSGETSLELSFKPDFNSAVITIEKYGEDILPILRLRVKELCMKKIDTVYLELPLSEPASMYLVPQFRDLGFFFGGLIPEFRDGDILKMQYLNNIFIDTSKIMIASENGRSILDFIVADRESAG
ncbi:MAG: ATP-binding protein [Ignavibacteriales bacterium]|nr:ATP-binding protein [Ignavibacteriales bacterium]